MKNHLEGCSVLGGVCDVEVRAVRQIAGGRVDRSDRYAYGRAPKKFPLEGR